MNFPLDGQYPHQEYNWLQDLHHYRLLYQELRLDKIEETIN
jgi:hypothetical protein